MSDTGQSDVDGSSVLQYWIFSKDVLFRVISSGNGNMAHSSPGSLSSARFHIGPLRCRPRTYKNVLTGQSIAGFLGYLVDINQMIVHHRQGHDLVIVLDGVALGVD